MNKQQPFLNLKNQLLDIGNASANSKTLINKGFMSKNESDISGSSFRMNKIKPQSYNFQSQMN